MKQADQNSIMLYSQRNGYIFDMTYACHEATEQFKKFKSKAVPFRQMIKKNNVEVARFDFAHQLSLRHEHDVSQRRSTGEPKR